ncbi:7929_t:CDS:2 [Entrophospora sp. SA101]|nr:7929_t:CDS:2 [Entrophospora sp. SA101]
MSLNNYVSTLKITVFTPPLSCEILFSQLERFPWWPGLVEKEDELPENILKQRPDGQDYICVKFFGSTNYGWIIEKNLKPFTKKEANDKLKQTKKKSSLVGAINQALEYLPGKRKMNEEDETSVNSAGSSNGITKRKDDIKIKGKKGKEKVKEMTNQSVQNNIVINNHNDGGSGDGRTTRKRTRNNDNDNQVNNNQNKAKVCKGSE